MLCKLKTIRKDINKQEKIKVIAKSLSLIKAIEHIATIINNDIKKLRLAKKQFLYSLLLRLRLPGIKVKWSIKRIRPTIPAKANSKVTSKKRFANRRIKAIIKKIIDKTENNLIK